MCDTVLSLAFNKLLPLARDHLLPLLKEAADMVGGVSKEIADLKKELEIIEKFISNADRTAHAEEDKKVSNGNKAMIKQLIEASFHMEDVIDDYIFLEEHQSSDPGCAAGVELVKTMILRLQIAYKIQDIKSRMSEIEDTNTEKDHGFQIQPSLENGSSSPETNKNAVLLQKLRDAPLYMDESEVVGFEEPRDKLIDLLVEGRAERTVVPIVGMGGLGKTTLAKKVFDNQKVVKNFDCHVWITVSQQYKIKNLLSDILQQRKDPPQNLNQMDRKTLVDEVRNYLQGKRYVVVFDDVWESLFWDDIEFAMIDNKNGSRILITTRNKDVADGCKKSFCKVHEMERLSEKQSLELFKKKAFHNMNRLCRDNLLDISSKIVEKCKGLPLAIVVTGDILSRKDGNLTEWFKFSESISAELEEYFVIRKILGFSYHDLPYNLKSCFLYFGLYPEDYIVRSKTVTRQWIAEGFVKESGKKTLEEVAEGYLKELIHRSLVQVDSISIDGRVKTCRVHDLVHAMILEKYEELCFSKNIAKDNQLSLTRVTRRLSMATGSDNPMEGIESSHVRSVLVFEPERSLESFVKTIPRRYRWLKVLALRSHERLEVPNDLGSLNHLKYFGFWLTKGGCSGLPKSIGMLVNLETLDLRYANFENPNMSKEICKLRKLRHFLGYQMSLIQLKDGIGGMTSLQTLNSVYLDDGEDENDNRVVELIKELGKLKQLRELGLAGIRSKYMSAISSSINQMQQMEKLRIGSIVKEETLIGLDLNSPPPRLQRLKLFGYLHKFPEWILKLQNLVKLRVMLLKEGNDTMKLLQSMPNLLSLNICGNVDNDKRLERLHFQEGGFMNLKELSMCYFDDLSCIVMDKGALGSLKKLVLIYIPKLMTLPTGIKHLKKLEVLLLHDMSVELKQSIAADEGKEHWIFNQVPFIRIF